MINGFEQLNSFPNQDQVSLFGGDGNDTIQGRDDALGDDYIFGGDGADCLIGHDGFDSIYHNTEAAGTASDGDDDTLHGGAGEGDHGWWNETTDGDAEDFTIETDNRI